MTGRGRGQRNQWVAAVAASLSAVGSAAAYAWLTPLLPRMLSSSDDDLDLPAALRGGGGGQQLWWAASVVELGCLVGPLPAAALASRVGRKLVILASAPLLLLGWTVLLRWRTLLALAVARFVHGAAAGALFAAVPAYLGEIASARTRRAFSTLFPAFWWAGYTAQCWAGAGAGALRWLPYTYLAIGLNLPFCLLFVCQPESPAFHLLVGDEERATRALLYFRDGSVDEVKRELDEMRLDSEASRRSPAFRELTSTAADQRALTLLLAVITVRIAGGNAVLAVYAAHIFARVPAGHYVTVAFGLVMLVCSVISTCISDTFGRRPLLLVSCAGGALCHTVTATYFLLIKGDAASWLPALTVLSYAALYSIGMNPVTVAYTSELFRPTTRGVAAGLSTMYTTGLIFVLIALYEPVLHDFGMHVNFYLYSLACLFGCIYFYLRAPETKGKSFFQIRKELSGRGSGVGAAVEYDSEREPLFYNVHVDQL